MANINDNLKDDGILSDDDKPYCVSRLKDAMAIIEKLQSDLDRAVGLLDRIKLLAKGLNMLSPCERNYGYGDGVKAAAAIAAEWRGNE